ncbi:MAG: hypothetical protein DVB31_01770 [Verrucomicrobia bacterium]|nr:MAG: hypothetical protein DVB31_01770 [Verrucomicrobiota bacterium]
MKPRWTSLAVALAIALASHHAAAQDAPVPPPPAIAPVPDVPPVPAVAPTLPDNSDVPTATVAKRISKPRRAPRHGSGDVVVNFDDFVLKAGQTAPKVVVTFGDARIEGDVEGDVVGVFGKVTVLGQVSGNVVNVGSGLMIEDGARIGGNVVAVGYGLTRGTDGVVAGQVQNVGLTALPQTLRSRAIEYSDRCILLARPLAPGLGWLWIVWGALLAMHALLALLFPSAVGRILRTMEERPGRTALLGILGIPLLLVGITLVGATVVLLLALPFLFAAIVMGLLLGRTAIYQYIGRRILGQFGMGEARGLPPFAIGAGITTGLFLVPVAGLFVWFLFGLWAIGAVLLTVFSRDNPGSTDSAGQTAAATTTPPSAEPPAFGLPVDAVPVEAASAMASSTATDGPAVAPASVVGTDAADTIPAASLAGGASVAVQGIRPPAATPGPEPGANVVPARAPFWRKAASLAIDWTPVLVLAALLPDRFLFLRFDHHLLLVRVVLAVAYYAGMLAWRGTTLGGILFELRVARVDGGPVTREVALVRAASAVLSGMAFGLGWFWSLWDARGQAWHDKLAGTVVVRDHAPRPLV